MGRSSKADAFSRAWPVCWIAQPELATWRWCIGSNRIDPSDALLRISSGRLNMAKWLIRNYPAQCFDDSSGAPCNLELVQWVARECKWKVKLNDHRSVWIDNSTLRIIRQNQSEASYERELVAIAFLYSIHSDFDRKAYIATEMPPLPPGACYRTRPWYFPPHPTEVMDVAAYSGNLSILQRLHANRNDGCTTDEKGEATAKNHFEVVKWLHENRPEGCSRDAMSRAIGNGHLEMNQWLHVNTSKGCDRASMNTTAGRDN